MLHVPNVSTCYGTQQKHLNLLNTKLKTFNHLLLKTEKPPIFKTYPIQDRILALGEYSFALPPNRASIGPHGHSLKNIQSAT